LEQAARGVQAMHRVGLVHRDLKPSNILLHDPDVASLSQHPAAASSEAASESPGEARLLSPNMVAKVADLGLARRVVGDEGEALTPTGELVGTPAYMPPEQAKGEGKRVGPAADVYGLGAVLYECLTGRPPFAGQNTPETLVQVLQNEPVP